MCIISGYFDRSSVNSPLPELIRHETIREISVAAQVQMHCDFSRYGCVFASTPPPLPIVIATCEKASSLEAP